MSLKQVDQNDQFVTDQGSIFISGVAYALGNPTPVSALVDRGIINAETLTNLVANGVTSFCEQSDDRQALYLGSIRDTLRETGLAIDEVGGVIFAEPTIGWDVASEAEFMDALRAIGFKSGPVIGVGAQNCSALATAITTAKQLVTENSKPVLAIFSGMTKKDGLRYGSAVGTVFGDCIASMIVSSETGPFRILAAKTCANASLANRWLNPNLDNSDSWLYLGQAYRLIADTVAHALRKATINIVDIDLVCATNSNLSSLAFMAEAVRIPMEKVWIEDLVKIGHFYSCDNLIGLKNARDSERLRPGQIALLIGWSLYTISVVVVDVTQ